MANLKKANNEKQLTEAQKRKLQGYTVEIQGLIKTTLESAVRIGEILNIVKEEILDYGEFQDWIDNSFTGHIKHDTARNFINLYMMYEKYHKEYEDGFKQLSLSTLYVLGRSTTEEEVQEKVLELAKEEKESVSRTELGVLLRTYRKAKMVEAGIEPEVISQLENNPIVENPKELSALKKLSKKKRKAVVELLDQGGVTTTKEAVKKLLEEREEKEKEQTVNVDYTITDTRHFKSIVEIKNESIDLAIVEAPLKSDYVFEELTNLAIELDRVLTKGGKAIITVGHKAALFAGDRIEPLKPLHLLCLRRQPGNSRAIVGTNIISASVFCILAYKQPYRQPKQMLVDLQTIDPQEEVTGQLDEVLTGLEQGFERFINCLVEPEDTVMHVIESKQHFKIREDLESYAYDAKASSFISVG